MLRYRTRIRLFAAALAALAGFVDAVAFVRLGGFFVSFMSGNSTRLAVALAGGQPPLAGGLIAAFVLGVAGGTLAATVVPPRHRSAAVLGLVAGLLVIAGLFDKARLGLAGGVVMAMAMGAENGVFSTGGEVQIGVTYMTGTLVKLGQGLAAAACGGSLMGWAPYLLLWMGLVAGAVAGAEAYARLGSASFWIAAAAALGMALTALRLGALEDHLVASAEASP